MFTLIVIVVVMAQVVVVVSSLRRKHAAEHGPRCQVEIYSIAYAAGSDHALLCTATPKGS